MQCSYKHFIFENSQSGHTMLSVGARENLEKKSILRNWWP